MRKYFLVAIMCLVATTAKSASIMVCHMNNCQMVNSATQYPFLYDTLYRMFKDGIAQDVALCESGPDYNRCIHNGLRYNGRIGVSPTNFNFNANNILDARINPANRNLEIIATPYLYVNGRRSLCSSSREVLTLDNEGIALVSKGISCPYNLQFASDEKRIFVIDKIDIDNNTLGVRYNIMAGIGADINAKGYALMSFTGVPQNQTVARSEPRAPRAARTESPINLPTYNLIPQPPYGSFPETESSLLPQAYGMPLQSMQGMTGHMQEVERMPQLRPFPQPLPYEQPQERFSYKSHLPYPWGYYYAPNTQNRKNGPASAEAPAERKRPVKMQNNEMQQMTIQGKGSYSISPLPKTAKKRQENNYATDIPASEFPLGTFSDDEISTLLEAK